MCALQHLGNACPRLETYLLLVISVPDWRTDFSARMRWELSRIKQDSIRNNSEAELSKKIGGIRCGFGTP